MPKPEIIEFAKLLLQEVRDRAIQSCDTLLDPEAKSVTANRWREQLNGGSPQSFATTVIPDCVDDALFYLLYAIDSGVIRLFFKAGDGKVVDLTNEGEGELAGWFMGTNGWRAAYSRQRFIDDFKDLQ